MKYTSVTQSILCLIFLMYIATIQLLKYSGQKRFTINDSNTPVILSQGQGHQTWNELVDPQQGYGHPKSERPPSNSAR